MFVFLSLLSAWVISCIKLQLEVLILKKISIISVYIHLSV